MPNHCGIVCRVGGIPEELKRFMDTFSFEKQECSDYVPRENGQFFYFDFDNIIFMPSILRDTMSSSESEMGKACLAYLSNCNNFLADRTIAAIKEKTIVPPDATLDQLVLSYLLDNPNVLREGRKCLTAKAETGYDNWFSWAVDNWGTKWNSYDTKLIHEGYCVEDGGTFIQFSINTAWDFPRPIFTKLAEMFPNLYIQCVFCDEGRGFAGTFEGHGTDTTIFLEDGTEELCEAVFAGEVSF